MQYRHFVPLIILNFAVSGCAASPARLYPICFFDGAPTTEEQNDQFYKTLEGDLRTALGSANTIEIAATPDGRWLVAKTTKAENLSAAEVWPRIGCVGTALDSGSTKKEAACVEFVNKFILTGSYFSFGNAKDAGGFDIWNESPGSSVPVYCHTKYEGQDNPDT